MFSEQGKIKGIAHYYPVIGRGNVSHDTLSHEKVEDGLEKSFARTFKEWCRQLLDWHALVSMRFRLCLSR